MQTTFGKADRYVIGRENNVVLVDFRRPEPPAPDFPGAGALRAAKRIKDELDCWFSSDQRSAQQFA